MRLLADREKDRMEKQKTPKMMTREPVQATLGASWTRKTSLTRRLKSSRRPTTSASKSRTFVVAHQAVRPADDSSRGAAEILTHPREIASLVRRTDDTRATKRAAKAERKAAERAVKEEEARRQKGEKRREMEKQMSSLRKDLGFTDGDGDVDWDELEKVMEGEYDEGEWERVVGQMLEKQNRDVSHTVTLYVEEGCADLFRRKKRTMGKASQSGRRMWSRWSTRTPMTRTSRCTCLSARPTAQTRGLSTWSVRPFPELSAWD